MRLTITCTHKLGFTYQLITDTRYWTEIRAVDQAKKTAADHFGLLPAPTDFTVEVKRETN